MRISVITPSYNQAAFLEETIQSVLGQDYPDLEYIVVDGNSTDGSQDIIRRYAERLAWWVSEPDDGQAEAINKGMARASGDVLAWLNSDDVYRPGALRRVAQIFAAQPQIGLLYGDVESIDAAGHIFYRQRFAPYTLDDLMAFRIISQPAVFMRRSLWQQIGGLDTRYHFLLDHHLWLRAARLTQLFYLPQTLAAARYHAEAKNVARAAEFGREAFRLVDWMRTQPDLAERFAHHRRRILAGAHRLDAYYLVEAGRYASGLRAYARVWRYNPSLAARDWRRQLYALTGWLGLGAPMRSLYQKRQRTRHAD